MWKSPTTYVTLIYVSFCVSTLWFNFWAGAVFVGLGVVGSLAALYLVYENRKLMDPAQDP